MYKEQVVDLDSEVLPIHGFFCEHQFIEEAWKWLSESEFTLTRIKERHPPKESDRALCRSVRWIAVYNCTNRKTLYLGKSTKNGKVRHFRDWMGCQQRFIPGDDMGSLAFFPTQCRTNGYPFNITFGLYGGDTFAGSIHNTVTFSTNTLNAFRQTFPLTKKEHRLIVSQVQTATSLLYELTDLIVSYLNHWFNFEEK